MPAEPTCEIGLGVSDEEQILHHAPTPPRYTAISASWSA
jgi:hypothetical protein